MGSTGLVKNGSGRKTGRFHQETSVLGFQHSIYVSSVPSELKLESKLEATTVVQRVGDLAECRRAQVRVRVRKLGRVEEVDRLGAKGENHFRAQRPRAGEGGVHVADASPPEGVEPEVAARIVRLDQREGRTRQARL